MTATREVLDALPIQSSVDLGKLAMAIEELLATERTSSACAGAMVGEDDSSALVDAIRADLDCVDVVHAASSVLSRFVGANVAVVRSVLAAAIAACERSNAECGKHAGHHGHCRLCSDTTSSTITACRDLMASLAD
jgi:2-keto-3-deoxy-L-rhamnonate aldolase RhmA